MFSQLLHQLIIFKVQLELYHWQTRSYPRHKATDDLYEHLSDTLDEFVEYEQGRTHSRIKFENVFITVLSDKQMESELERISELAKQYKTSDRGIRARLDDLIGWIHRTLYIFTLY